jgi:hypothetical protein
MAQDPVLRVLRGEPSDDELAALAAVVLATTTPESGRQPASGQPQVTRSRWADRSAMMRHALRPGAEAWRMSTWRACGGT